MSLKLLADIEGWESVSRSLDSVRAGHDECARSFGQTFDRFDSLLAELSEEQDRLRTERLRAETDLNRLAEELDEQRAEFEAGKGEIDELRRQLESLNTQRSELESELETAGTRAAEMAQELDDQKEQMARRQDQWTEEFRAQRGLLNKLVSVLTQGVLTQGVLTQGPSARPDPNGADQPDGDDAVLDSVKAQFETLKKGSTQGT